jgi:hypothetical protein
MSSRSRQSSRSTSNATVSSAALFATGSASRIERGWRARTERVAATIVPGVTSPSRRDHVATAQR